MEKKISDGFSLYFSEFEINKIYMANLNYEFD